MRLTATGPDQEQFTILATGQRWPAMIERRLPTDELDILDFRFLLFRMTPSTQGKPGRSECGGAQQITSTQYIVHGSFFPGFG